MDDQATQGGQPVAVPAAPDATPQPQAPAQNPGGFRGGPGGRGGRGGGGGRGGRGGGRFSGPRGDQQQSPYIEKLISINRVTKVHKGGKRMAFDALAVVGDGKGRVGVAMEKSNEASEAIRKAFTRAQLGMVVIELKGATIPHEAVGRFDACRVLLKPASPGTGIIAGGSVRAVCEACGIKDILTKSLGSSNGVNLARATLQGLLSLQSLDAIRQRRQMIVGDVEGD